MVRGEGTRVYDANGTEYFDGLSGLFTNSLGHGRADIGEPRPRRRSASWPSSRCGPTRTPRPSSWPSGSPASPRATSTASSSPPAAPRRTRARGSWRASTTRCAATLDRYKVISRDIAYHGTTLGALTITSLEGYRKPFEPLVPGAIKVPAANFYRAEKLRRRLRSLRTLVRRTRSKRRSCARAPRPSRRSSSSRCRTPAAASRPRRATGKRCARSATATASLLVSDEVICAFGRIGIVVRWPEVRLRSRHHHLRQGHHRRATRRSGR